MNALTENVDISKVHKYRFLMISSPTYSKHKKMLQQKEKSYTSVHSSIIIILSKYKCKRVDPKIMSQIQYNREKSA